MWAYANDVRDGPEYWFEKPCLSVTYSGGVAYFGYECNLQISRINKNGRTIVECRKDLKNGYVTWYGGTYKNRVYSDRCYTFSENQIREAKAKY